MEDDGHYSTMGQALINTAAGAALVNLVRSGRAGSGCHRRRRDRLDGAPLVFLTSIPFQFLIKLPARPNHQNTNIAFILVDRVSNTVGGPDPVYSFAPYILKVIALSIPGEWVHGDLVVDDRSDSCE